jgi:DNA-binding CsgD family transcriptional regulator
LKAFGRVRSRRLISAATWRCRSRWCRPACAGAARRPLAELETLALLSQGKPYGKIADELNVSYKTVVNTCSQLKQKLDARNLPELIRMAVQLLATASA